MTDMYVNPRMGDIGEEQEEIELEPLHQPEHAPVKEPAAPEPVKVPEPSHA